MRTPRRWGASLAVLLSVAVAASAAASVVSLGRATPAPGRQDRSILDGVFTADQASRGRQTFQRACVSCHEIREFTGRRFSAKWGAISLGDLFEIIATTMPEGGPGSLEAGEYAGVLAYLLKESGYPEGREELPSRAAALMRVRIEPLPK